MQQEFITKLGKARAELTAAQERGHVLRLAKNDLVSPPGRLHHRPPSADHHGAGNWWDKYAVSLRRIEAERDAVSAELTRFLRGLGYE